MIAKSQQIGMFNGGSTGVLYQCTTPQAEVNCNLMVGHKEGADRTVL
jgi:hypothetical protein